MLMYEIPYFFFQRRDSELSLIQNVEILFHRLLHKFVKP